MSVIWTPEAQQDRIDIWDYLVTENPPAAIRMDELFSTAASRLTTHPMLGHQGIIPGTRETFPHENYRLVYEVHNEHVWILALVHTSRQWPLIEA
jgi:addiction module RelE/StbE family toxin